MDSMAGCEDSATNYLERCDINSKKRGSAARPRASRMSIESTDFVTHTLNRHFIAFAVISETVVLNTSF